MINGITFNPEKSKWLATDTAKDFSDFAFKLGGVIIERENVCISYLGVNFMMKRKMLVIDVDERIRTFNSSVYSVLLNLYEQVRYEIIVKKCSPNLIYCLGCGHIWSDDAHRFHVAYRKIFRYIFGYLGELQLQSC